MLVSEKQQQNQFHAIKGAGVDCVKKTKNIQCITVYHLGEFVGGREIVCAVCDEADVFFSFHEFKANHLL